MGFIFILKKIAPAWWDATKLQGALQNAISNLKCSY